MDAASLTILLLSNSRAAYSEYVKENYRKIWTADLVAVVALVLVFATCPSLSVVKWCLFLRYFILLHYENIAFWSYRKG